MELYLKEKIEALRYKMIKEAAEYGCLHHEKVLEISRQLDEYIVVYQKAKPETIGVLNSWSC
ncbi:aspartyl-phosphate phosphatase Spo0E family protein [Paenibacillus allorhizosphaerae]|uniref:Aspartyl-phosphate phosphatase Spo0E family protein n=1 Tax=Paenibacillus allorhizosphaerae TaxID=2849866 RepID=A0ABM8VGC1_9BACL|nr:aspartyl-phosphate phosphatase Spo0E family protein [Paenibacillus allorhizosphaerae]CAG7638021.1 hypothetical protein PAECIP111802_02398 [Paenibacillus allorhizosphaerae]